MTEEQIRDALRHLLQSEEILHITITINLDEYRAIEAEVRKESAERTAELEQVLGITKNLKPESIEGVYRRAWDFLTAQETKP